jgi:hypothetical protein
MFSHQSLMKMQQEQESTHRQSLQYIQDMTGKSKNVSQWIVLFAILMPTFVQTFNTVQLCNFWRR